MTRRRLFAWGVGATVVAALAVAVAGWYGWSLLRTEPDHWTSAQAQLESLGPATAARAESVEVRLLPAWSAPVQPGGTGVRTIEARYDEVNAWFAVRLRQYLSNQGVAWPDALGAVMLAGRNGRPVLAFDVDAEGFQQIVSLTLDFPASDTPGGPAGMVVERVEAGVLPLPAGRLVALLKSQVLPDDLDPGVLALLDAIAAGQPIRPLVLPIDDLREAELLGVEASDDTMAVTIRVRRKQAPSQR